MSNTKNRQSKTSAKIVTVATLIGIGATLLPANLAEASPRREARESRGYAQADVIRAEPQYELVRREVPREVCRTEEYTRPRGDYSVTSPVLGAVIGGALGNAVGHSRRNKQVGVAVGALLGGAIGHDIARRNQARNGGYDVESRDVCRIETSYEEDERLTGYEVTYRYAGETFTTFMDRDPGPRLRVRVDVTPVEGDYNRHSDRDWNRGSRR
jgi:uncharacterized protein YcfJ